MASDRRQDQEQSHESPSAAAARETPDGPMTDNQAERLRVPSDEIGEPFEADRTTSAAEAERRIRELQQRAGYGEAPPRPDAVP